ncbi:MAG: 2OG-Fe(II) oxygenase family protein [Pseudomonadota bacterium]
MPDLSALSIAPLFSDDAEARAAVDAAVRDAVLREGGFAIVDFPDAQLLDQRCATMLRFFDLAEAEKLALATKPYRPEGPRIYRGYRAALECGDWAHNEMFDVGPEVPTAGPELPGMEILAETNVWPAREPVAGWQATMQAFYRQMEQAGLAIMLSAGRAFGFSDEALAARFQGGNSTLRLLHYPLPPADWHVIDEAPDADGEVEDIALASGRHTDVAGVSLLWQAQPGLQAQAQDGTWRDVPHVANSISVHLGDVLEVMTGGGVPATPHRVVNHGVARQSIGFFLEPALGAQLAALESKNHGTRGTYGWHLLRRVSSYSGNAAWYPRPE